MSFQILCSLASPRLCHSTWDQMAPPRTSPSNSDSWEGDSWPRVDESSFFFSSFLQDPAMQLNVFVLPWAHSVSQVRGLRAHTTTPDWGTPFCWCISNGNKAIDILLAQSSWTNGCGWKCSAQSSVFTRAIWSSYTVLMKHFAGVHHTDCRQTHIYCVKSVRCFGYCHSFLL